MDKTCHGLFGHKSLCCSYTQLIMGKWKAIKTKMTEERKEAPKYANRQKTEYYNEFPFSFTNIHLKVKVSIMTFLLPKQNLPSK